MSTIKLYCSRCGWATKHVKIKKMSFLQQVAIFALSRGSLSLVEADYKCSECDKERDL